MTEVSDVAGDEYDCCVVGAGPVGLTFAMEAADVGLRVLLIDAGDRTSVKQPVTAFPGQETHIVDPARHAPLELAVRRGVGGTARMWGGRIVAFQPIDFEKRDYVPTGEWPIALEEVAQWYAPAARHLDCGPAVFTSEGGDWSGLTHFEMSNLERWVRQPRLDRGLAARVLGHPRVSVLLDTRLIDLDLAADGSVTGIVAERQGARTSLRAGHYVLAMGGLEDTRFLLDVQRRRPEWFGGVDGPLGRYYMGHVTGSIAHIVLHQPERVGDLDFVLDESGSYIRRRFTLTAEAQRAHRVLNTSFYLDNPAFHRYEHGNATLSAVFLALTIPPIGRRMVAERMRLRHIGSRPYRVTKHMRNVLRNPLQVVADAISIIRGRYISTVRKPGFILHNEAGRYAIHYHAEQLPNPDSRLMMHAGPDGNAVLDIDFRYLDADIESVVRCHELLDADLRSAGLGHLEYIADSPDGVRDLLWKQSSHGLHNIGSTRMSTDPATGVVDPHLRVHGTRNLYVASTSVFPTSGEANPTFFAAVLAVRLAHHLAEGPGLAKEPVVKPAEPVTG